MPSRGRKNRKKHENARASQTDAKCSTCQEIFRSDEISQLRLIFGTEHLANVPAIIKAAVLNKLENVVTIIDQGANINETGPYNMTALSWAVKLKHEDVVDYLLSHGADPTIKSEDGDEILFIALNGRWNESSFIKLWRSLSNCSSFVPLVRNKAGQSVLHLAVAKEWKNFIILMIETEHIPMDLTDTSGITPLMVACFLLQYDMINLLLQRDAEILKEDHAGITALCYAISSTVTKKSSSTGSIVNILISALNTTYTEYLRTRLNKCLELSEYFTNTFSANSDILKHIFSFTVRFIKNGVKMILEIETIQKISENIMKSLSNIAKCKLLLTILAEIISYNESCIGYTIIQELAVTENFFASKCNETCLEIIKKFNVEEGFEALVSIAVYIIQQAYSGSPSGSVYMMENRDDILTLRQKLLTASNVPIHQPNEIHAKLVTAKITKFKEKLKAIDEDYENDCDLKSIFKKPKKKPKPCKITKIKNSDLAEQLNIKEKITLNYGVSGPPLTFKDNIHQGEASYEDENEVVNALKRTILNTDDASECSFFDICSSKEAAAMCGSCKCLVNHDEERDQAPIVFYQKSDSLEQKYYNSQMLESAISYLRKLLHQIIGVYQNHWKCDKANKDQGFSKVQEKENPGRCSHHSDLLQAEMECVERLQAEFEKLVTIIKDQAQRNMSLCQMAVNKLESLLLTHEIRGKTIILESVSAECCPANYHFIDDLMEKGSCDTEDLQSNSGKSYEEACTSRAQAKPKSPDPEHERLIQKKTMDNAYHLVPSILKMCDNTIDLPDVQTTEKQQTLERNASSSDRSSKTKPEYSEILLRALVKHVDQNSGSKGVPSRWTASIQSLQKMPNCQKMLGGDIRVSCKEKRIGYVISTGGNFNAVQLGLDSNNRPLAIKRIPKESNVCKTLKVLINPLLGLRNTHILHYFACDYENNELILATPLCEYNIGQYLMLLRQNAQHFLTAAEVVSQFLAGLKFLHCCKEPVIHGNLKPSNIFLDLNGIVRIGEFGIHKALFKLNEAPDSSVIWFARETYQGFKQNSVVDCSLQSDIQVAGMLIHFILTAGKHPYGDDMKEIMKNLEKSTPKLSTHDVDLQDLITWMLLYDPVERPTILQVLSHVYFWSTERKWCFILTCAGVGASVASFNINELHSAINRTARKDDIKGSWVVVVKRAFPEVPYSDDDDTPTGLLRFIKSHLEKRAGIEVDEMDLCKYILNAFPALPLSLYRILESTSWLSHPAFTIFTEIG